MARSVGAAPVFDGRFVRLASFLPLGQSATDLQRDSFPANHRNYPAIADQDMAYAHKFHKPTADVILCSSDGVKFRVHKLVLSEASPVFAGMFLLPEPAITTGHEDYYEDGVPIVQLEEAGSTIDLLLALLYPGMGPPVSSLTTFVAVLSAAQKYEMDGIEEVLRGPQLDDMVEREPWRAFAIAQHFELDGMAALAEKGCLRRPPPNSPFPEMDWMTVSKYHSLLQRRQQRVDAFNMLLEEPQNMYGSRATKDSYAWMFCEKCAGANLRGGLTPWFKAHLYAL